MYEKETARLLGAQAFGHAGVDKRIDALAMALHGNLTLHDLAEVSTPGPDPVNLWARGGERLGHSPELTSQGKGGCVSVSFNGACGYHVHQQLSSTTLRVCVVTACLQVDFCYAPPYSSANDHINIAAFVGLNDVSGEPHSGQGQTISAVHWH